MRKPVAPIPQSYHNDCSSETPLSSPFIILGARYQCLFPPLHSQRPEPIPHPSEIIPLILLLILRPLPHRRSPNCISLCPRRWTRSSPRDRTTRPPLYLLHRTIPPTHSTPHRRSRIRRATVISSRQSKRIPETLIFRLHGLSRF